jgi:hypothetical protein
LEHYQVSSSPTSNTKSDPIFVLGAERSGTTVFRLMLDSHEELCNPGDVHFIFKHLKSGSIEHSIHTAWKFLIPTMAPSSPGASSNSSGGAIDDASRSTFTVF